MVLSCWSCCCQPLALLPRNNQKVLRIYRRSEQAFGNGTYHQRPRSAILKFYRSGIPYLIKANSNDYICETYLGMARLFLQMGQTD